MGEGSICGMKLGTSHRRESLKFFAPLSYLLDYALFGMGHRTNSCTKVGFSIGCNNYCGVLESSQSSGILTLLCYKPGLGGIDMIAECRTDCG